MTHKEKSEFQKSILDSITEKPHGRLLLAPRSGKTKLAIDLIKKFKPKSILWVTVSKKLAEEDIPEEFIKWRAKSYLPKLKTVTWASLNKVEGHYEMIILDEEQYATVNNTGTLLDDKLTFDYITSMTGTPSHEWGKALIYRALDLEVLYKMSISAAVDMGMLADYEINVIRVNMSSERNLEAGGKNRRFMTSERAQYIYVDRQAEDAVSSASKNVSYKLMARMRAIHSSPSKTEVARFLFNNLKGRKLLFGPTVKQIESITDRVYHGSSDDRHLKAFSEGLTDSVAMVNKGGTGYTYRAIDHLILMQVDSDANGLTSQKIARSLLNQEDYKAKIWVLCLAETRDEKWVKSLEKRFNKDKIHYYDFNKDLETILTK